MTPLLEGTLAQSSRPRSSVPLRVRRATIPSAVGWSILGPVIVVAVWEALALGGLQHEHILPTPTSVVSTLFSSGSVLSENLPYTALTAALGFAWGVAAALALGLLCSVSRMVETIVIRIAIALHSLPIIALAPILLVLSSGRTPGVIVAALSVFFLTLINFLAGLASTPPLALEMNRAFGGSPLKSLVAVKLRYALPSLFTGLMLSAPMALVGALIAEFLVTGTGLGSVLISAQEALNTSLVWMISIVCAAMSAAAYVTIGMTRKLVVPWANELTQDYRNAPDHTTSRLRALLGACISGLVTVALLLGIWVGGIHVLHLNSFFAKGPLDVLRYLVTGAGAWHHDTEILGYLKTTVVAAAAGLALGTAVAVLVAGAAVMWRQFELATVPSMVAFRAVPILALVPMISLLVRNGSVAAVVIAAVLCFFTTAVNLIEAGKTVPPEALRLGRAYNVGVFRLHWQVHRPYMTPALFTSLRITAPLSLIGTMTAEWLIAGNGIGHLMILAGSESEFTVMWSSFVVMTVVSMLIYAVVAALERLVQRRLS